MTMAIESKMVDMEVEGEQSLVLKEENREPERELIERPNGKSNEIKEKNDNSLVPISTESTVKNRKIEKRSYRQEIAPS